jgi:TRAP-type uncharacterized transport system substrate-binding protein
MLVLVLLAPGLPVSAAPRPEQVNRGLVGIVAGRVDGTGSRIAADLADVLDDGATRRILPIAGKSPIQNVIDLQALRGVDLAILNADVLAHAREQRLLAGADSITYVARLYDAEFHLLARDDVQSVRDLAGRKVNLDAPQGGDAAVTGAQIFRLLGVTIEPTSYDPWTALEKLKSGEIAAVAMIEGKPAPRLLERRLPAGVHFVRIPPVPELLRAYQPAQLTASDYPGLVPPDAPVDTVAVGTVLAAARFAPGTERYRNLANFVDAFFTNLSKFQEAPRHPKWREINIAADLPGWRRFGPAEEWLKKNGGEGGAMADAELRRVFGSFVGQRTRLSGGSTPETQRTDELFEQFQRWQRTRGR